MQIEPMTDFTNNLNNIAQHFWEKLPEFLATLLIGLLLIEITILIFGRILRLVKMPVALKKLVYALVRAFLWIILFLALIQTLGLNNVVVAFTGSSVILALFLSTGVAPIVTDILAGLSLASDKDFKEKVTVQAGDKGTKGVVERVELRKTRIRSADGKLHVIPNALVDKNEWVVLKEAPSRAARTKRPRRRRR